MALRPDRNTIETDITLTCDNVAERGVILVYGTNGSGVAIGDKASGATLAVSASGLKPAGLLINDVIVLDETRFHRNYHKDVKLVGERVTLGRKGRWVTDRITGTPNAGDTAYLGASGFVTPTVSATGGVSATPKVGVFAGRKDENGFAALDVTLPIA